MTTTKSVAQPQLQNIFANWTAPSNVIAFTTTRQGGISSGNYSSFNLGLHVDDDQFRVEQNRELLCKDNRLPTKPVWLQQTHSTKILNLDDDTKHQQIADGSITSSLGVVCAVMTADCLPLLLCDATGTKVAAIHAGWRGIADGIIEKGIKAMQTPTEKIIAWAGPSISVNHFEIGNEVRQQLGGSDLCYSEINDTNKCYANLYQITAERLAAVGVTQYSHAKYCTFADQSLFYSHRRDQQTGRMASIIYLG